MNTILATILSAIISASTYGGSEAFTYEPLPNSTALGGFSVIMDESIARGTELYSDDELELLANVMYHENYANGEYCMRLTGSVVLNRVNADWYPDTIEDVLYQKGQYSTVSKFFTTEIPDEVYQYAKELLIFGSIAPEYVLFQSMNSRLGKGIWYEYNGEYFNY